jgi:hypothetical protein
VITAMVARRVKTAMKELGSEDSRFDESVRQITKAVTE